jgi:hypothetical protein
MLSEEEKDFSQRAKPAPQGKPSAFRKARVLEILHGYIFARNSIYLGYPMVIEKNLEIQSN